jgi:hypothetical protein
VAGGNPHHPADDFILMPKTTLIIDTDLNKLMAAVGALRIVQQNTPGPYRLVGIGGGAVLVALLLSGHNADLEAHIKALNFSAHGLLTPSALSCWLKAHVMDATLGDLGNNFMLATNLENGHPIILPYDGLKWDLPDISLADATNYAARPPWLVDRIRYFICDGRLCNHETLELLSADDTIRIFTEIDPSTPLHGLGTARLSTSIQAGQHAQAIRNKSSDSLPRKVWDEMIVVHTDICPTKPRLTKEEHQDLYGKGIDAANKWYSDGVC